MLATTVANKWNGNQMQIWLPFVFYTPHLSAQWILNKVLSFPYPGLSLLTNSHKKITNTPICLDQTSFWYAKRV